jgi:excisionase family DNA binding protein
MSDALAYDLKGAAEVVPYSQDFLRTEIRAGRLKAKQPGRKLIITADALKEWLNSLADA